MFSLGCQGRAEIPEFPAAILTTHRGGRGGQTAKGEYDRNREVSSRQEEEKERENRKMREGKEKRRNVI